MAAVYVSPDDAPFIVAETPSEVAAMMTAAIAAGDPLVMLTLGNLGDWNAKPLYVRPQSVIAISPPKDLEPDDDD